MLPFLQPKKIASIVMMSRKKKDGSIEPVNEENEHKPELIQACENILKAINNKDSKELASALISAYSTMENAEHELEESE